jgi:hypothetical protein
MTPHDTSAGPLRARMRPWLLMLVHLVLLSRTATATAQDVVAARPAEDVIPAALQQAMAAQNVAPNPAVPPAERSTPLLQAGPITVQASVSYRLLFGDGLPASNGQRLTSTIHDVAPDLSIDLGTHWVVNYVPAWVFYSNSAFTDSVDQSIRLAGWAAYEDWVLHLSQSFLTSSSPTIETGQQTKQTSWLTKFDGTLSLNSKVALEFSALQFYRSAETFTSSREWSTMDWLHYRIAPRLDTAAGLGFGYVNVSEGSDMTFVRPQGQVTWGATDKITLGFHGGVEYRKSVGDSSAGQNNPIYGGSVQYRPFDTTTLALAANREVAASYFANQLTKSTGWTVTLQQRLLQQFYLNIGVAHQKVAYVSSVDGASEQRNDDNSTITARLSTVLFRRCTVAAVYQNIHNSSAVPGYGLSSTQVGLEVSYQF